MGRKQLSPILETGGGVRRALGPGQRLMWMHSSRLPQPSRCSQIPTIVVIKGRCCSQGACPNLQVRQYIEELLRVAGEAEAGSVGSAPVETEQPPEDPALGCRRRRDQAGNWDEAIALYEQLRAVDPEQAQAAIAQVHPRAPDRGGPAGSIAAADADPTNLESKDRR